MRNIMEYCHADDKGSFEMEKILMQKIQQTTEELYF